MTCVVAGTASRRKTASRSATAGGKDLVSRLTEAGEDTLRRISELPGGQRAVTAFNDLKHQVDDLGKKVRGIDALEERIAKLEKEVASLKRGSTSRRSPTRKSSAT
jgi:uncharacterized small protein (DUF1192 family)